MKFFMHDISIKKIFNYQQYIKPTKIKKKTYIEIYTVQEFCLISYFIEFHFLKASSKIWIRLKTYHLIFYFYFCLLLNPTGN